MGRRERPGRFGAVVTAMVTPFDDDGQLDVDGATALARWLGGHGSDALVLSGTTGEAPVLSDEEKRVLWRAVSEAVTIPVIAGTGTNDTRHSIDLTKAATEAGVDAVLVVTPYYSRPSQAGLRSHFAAVASATTLPVMLYDIPVRTGRRIAPSTVLGVVSDAANVVAVKDATGDPPNAARLLAEAGDTLELYSGDDAYTLPLLSLGAVGLVSVASHWAGPKIAEMISLFLKGDPDGASRRNADLISSYDFESTEEFPNPVPAKAACRALGLAVGQCRPPLGAAPPELDERARQLLGEAAR